MERFYLRVRAPFAAFRPMMAGVLRPTMPVMPYSAAWGLLLNLAGIESRGPLTGVTTGLREGLPALRLALGEVPQADERGEPGPPQHERRASLYQQLHTYPVGSSGKELAERTHGAKYWIAPTRRELLVDLDLVVACEAPASLLERVRRGLAGTLEEPRYGLPFAGDNNLLFDELAVLERAPEARWYTPLREGEGPREGSARLTVSIDRGDSARTRSLLVAPEPECAAEPPAEAWVWTPREGATAGP